MSRIIILGSGGFIGRNLAAQFPQATCYRGRQDLDVRNAEQLAAIDFSDAIIFVCCSRGGRRGVTDSLCVYLDNMCMLVNLLGHPLRQCKRMVLFSSGAAFGRVVKEAGAAPPATVPNDPYGDSKAEWEQAASILSKVVVLRIFGCFGDDEEPQRLRKVCQREDHVVITDDRFFDYVDVKDVQRFCQWLVEHPQWTWKGAFNLVYKDKKKLSEWAVEWGVSPNRITVVKSSSNTYTGEYHNMLELLAS